MKTTQQPAQQLCQWKIQVTKKDSAFVYFTLEASEGACFYSTLDNEDQLSNLRALEVTSTLPFKKQIEDIFTSLRAYFPLEVIAYKQFTDQ